ncbi:MAG: hypothetical protein JJU21_16725 [Salinarimonas sp.]|nr:hypothetical protein [Salinarimonas sp.]
MGDHETEPGREAERIAHLHWLSALIPADAGWLRLATTSFILSLVGLALATAAYILTYPALRVGLMNDPMLLNAFTRQIVASGLLIVFVINMIGFANYRAFVTRGNEGRSTAAVLGVDLFTRGLLFFGMHVISYYLAAEYYGSFGGNTVLALQVVAPTLAAAAWLGNLSGVYLWATAISALPFFMVVLAQGTRGHGRLSDGIRSALSRLGRAQAQQARPGWQHCVLAILVFITFAVALSLFATLLALIIPVSRG